VPALAFAEACVGLGIFISGAFLVAVATFALNYGIANIETICLLAGLGAIAGDHAGFYVGIWLGPNFHQTKLAKRYTEAVSRGEALVLKYGAWAIFIGRFIPAIRSIIPALIGLSEFNKTRYSVYDIAACALWSIVLGAIVAGIDSLI
jgi:membrane-associated protein